MANKFKGTIAELKQAVAAIGLIGDWTDKTSSNNGHIFKAESGEHLSWWPSSGTLQIQGKNTEGFQAKLMPQLSAAGAYPAITPAVTASDNAIMIPRPENNKQAEKKIFIVHGHDSAAREQLELILWKLGVQPFVLQNTDAGGKTLIEALEDKIDHTAALGIILLTPDDYGYPQDKTEADKQPRARQNVILEMGMVMAKLGRERTLILQKGVLERPSDTEGLQRHEFNGHVKEIVPKLVQRLKNLGFPITAEQTANAGA